MNGTTSFVFSHWQELMIPVAVVVLVWLVGLLARRLIFRLLARYASKTKTGIDDLLVSAMRSAFMLWVLLAGLYLAAQVSPLPERIARLAGQVTLIIWIISLVSVGSRIAVGAIQQWGAALPEALPVTTLTQNIARLSVFAVGGLILLNQFGISITPLLTALGVGGLAVALALQDTLSSLFAGFYVSLSGQIRMNDYIKLESGEEGYVTDISWRSTTIRALPNNLIIIPNGKLAQSIVTNYCLPEKRMSLLIPVSVSYSSDPDRVERVLIEEARLGADEIPGLLREPEPFVRFIPGFGESSLDFTLICQVREFVDQYAVQHELRKRLFRRLRQEGIEIPFPIRTVHLTHETHPVEKQPPHP